MPLSPSCVKMVHGFCLNLHVLESVLCLPVPALGAVSAWSSMGGRRPGVEWLLWLLFFIVRDVFQDPEIKLFSFLQQLSFFHRKGLMWMAIFALFTFGEKGEKERGSCGDLSVPAAGALPILCTYCSSEALCWEAVSSRPMSSWLALLQTTPRPSARRRP